MSKVNSIEELKQKCAEKNMPLEKMRFFIGEDRIEPKCFGVYQDEKTGKWIVYKNKADGSRAIRYNGPDEAEAAQIIWDKIGDEIKLRKDLYANPYDETAFRKDHTPRYGGFSGNKPSPQTISGYRDKPRTFNNTGQRSSEPEKPMTFLEMLLMFPIVLFSFLWEHKIAVIISAVILLGVFSDVIWPAPQDGYYRRGDETYYCLDDNWYIYEAGEWIRTLLDDDNIKDYYLGDTYYDDYGVSDFTDTGFYSDYIVDEYTGTHYNNNNYDTDNGAWYDNDYDDDDYDYDFDDWDTDDTDWDSDW